MMVSRFPDGMTVSLSLLLIGPVASVAREQGVFNGTTEGFSRFKARREHIGKKVVLRFKSASMRPLEFTGTIDGEGTVVLDKVR